MQVKEFTRDEIESRLAEMGDYVKIDYLSSCLKGHLDFDSRKFVLVKLSGIYESMKMFLNSAKMMRAAADINTTYQGKIIDFVKAAELFVKAGNYEEVDTCVKKAIVIANAQQKAEINNNVKNFYKTQAKILMGKDKRHYAMMVYERLLKFDLDIGERKEIQSRLLEVYEKLGKIREYSALKKTI